MARVNITVPDELLAQARAAGLNVSRLAAGALAAEVKRLDKIAGLDAYLRELELEQGPITEEKRLEGQEWVDRALAAKPPPRASGAAGRTP